jgi:hypothetical protein
MSHTATPHAADRLRARAATTPLPTWVGPAAAGVAALGACTIAGLTDSSDTWLPGCPFRDLTGLDCPGCGMTRGLRALTHGDVAGAADHNLLLVVLLPVLLVAWGFWMARSVKLTERRPLRWDLPLLSPILVGSIFTFWVVRDLPFDPFTWLASGA